MKRLLVIAVFLFFCALPSFPQVSPISGLGSIQLLANDGTLATSGCFYFYQAGTSTQQATFTDSTGTTQNTNPLCLGSGARATGVWLTTSQFYKIVACLNNDGAFCSASDILWSQDNVPGGASSSSGGASCASGCTGFFVSGTATPSTTGTLRLASGDSAPCWRNAAGSANLCWSKDSNDLLSWAGGTIKFPEVAAPSPVATFDILTANNTLHRWQQGNNGAALDTVVGAATVDTFTNKTYNAQGTGNNFQIGGTSISATGQSATTFLRGDGTWVNPAEQTYGWGISASLPSLIAGSCTSQLQSSSCIATVLASAHTLIRFTWILDTSQVGCATNAVIGVRDITSATNLFTVTINAQATGFQDSGALSTSMTAGHTFAVGLLTAASGCTTAPVAQSLMMVYQ